MVSTSIIRIQKFAKWTHFKSEAEILYTQHDIYSFFVREMEKIGAFVFPFLYDHMIVIMNGVDQNEFIKVIVKAEEKYGFQFYLGYSTHEYAAESVRLALCNINGSKELVSPSSDKLTCLHFDIDNYAPRLILDDISLHVFEIFHNIKKFFPEFIGFHISGDNYLMFGNETDEELIISKMVQLRNKYPMKLGVGKDYIPTKAADKSSQALECIREMRKETEESKILLHFIE